MDECRDVNPFYFSRRFGVIGANRMKIRHIDHVAIPVSDLARSIRWYQDVLGLTRRYEKEWGDYPAMMCAGETCVALIHPAVTLPLPPSPGSDPDRHLAFNVDREGFDEAVMEMAKRQIPFTTDDHGISLSIYFFDPDGHWIEITTFDLPVGRQRGDRPHPF
ncbi:VOC family protein [Leptospirillum ferrooxidans]|nr:VOC family protein [Leptospirillum ferrooxidans]